MQQKTGSLHDRLSTPKKPSTQYQQHSKDDRLEPDQSGRQFRREHDVRLSPPKSEALGLYVVKLVFTSFGNAPPGLGMGDMPANPHSLRSHLRLRPSQEP